MINETGVEMQEQPQNTIMKACTLHPALRPLIRHLVLIEQTVEQGAPPMVGNFMPSPDQAMFINLFTTFQAKRYDEQAFTTRTSCTFMGPQITPFKLAVWESHKTVSIIFHPGGLNRFLGIPMTELFDNGFCGAQVIGKEISDLVEQGHDLPTMEALDRLVQGYFLSKIARVKEQLPIDRALQYLMLHPNTDIGEIASMSCRSIRSFERLCKERLGMPAKYYARIARFNKAYKLLEHQPRVSWSSMATAVGYFDQMHFIKDFKEFAKCTPTFMQKELSEESIRFQLDWNTL